MSQLELTEWAPESDETTEMFESPLESTETAELLHNREITCMYLFKMITFKNISKRIFKTKLFTNLRFKLVI